LLGSVDSMPEALLYDKRSCVVVESTQSSRAAWLLLQLSPWALVSRRRSLPASQAAWIKIAVDCAKAGFHITDTLRALAPQATHVARTG